MESKEQQSTPDSAASAPQPRLLRLPARALLAGVAAGIIATPVQLLCWWLDGSPVLQLLLRDTRLAAAILLGPGVLPPPLDLDLAILTAAGAIHFLLSAVYGLVMMPLARLPSWAAAPAGAVAGAALFGINMYGFTSIFPWFAASRDWATFVAHLAFGVSAVWLTRGRR
ncbi:sodium:proline symporter [Noviherbaspirillum aridicola]|uniref:Sodium:proline symporter n=1 Tax=Noviherbaspirillum aridicola TaxID=2849687 RepID=A0ABQ4Q325_9BURK|nr:sodium:proline symporter [Noviherbaspirillum aridicola]GIZ51412.1 hypothetical protein NCCP691_14260 [Noviherbaspirillum aridicola]